MIEEQDKGWKREVNAVAWNSGIPRIDIRSWNPDHTKMSRGICVPIDEGKKLAGFLHDYYAGKEEKTRKTPARDDYER